MDSYPNTEYFRQRLYQMKQDIEGLQTTRDQSTATVILDQSSVGRLSRVDAMQQQAMAQSTEARARQTLQRIEAALRRCDDGSFGFCIECDEPNSVQRLEFDPTLLRCIQCAAAQER